MEMSDKKQWQSMPRWAKIAIVTAGVIDDKYEGYQIEKPFA
jgi:hypothetical protein